MMLGVGIVALPAGMIASGFNEELARKRLAREAATGICPTCQRAHSKGPADQQPGVTLHPPGHA